MTRQTRKKFVQVTLTDDEHDQLKQEAAARRMSMSALLASSWLQNITHGKLTVPLTEDDSKQLNLDAKYKGMTRWELLLSVWREWREDEHWPNPTMRGRHVRKK